MRPLGIIRANSFLPGTVKAVVSPQYAAHTAQANSDNALFVTNLRKMVPYHLGAALECVAYCQYPGYDLICHCQWAAMWSS